MIKTAFAGSASSPVCPALEETSDWGQTCLEETHREHCDQFRVTGGSRASCCRKGDLVSTKSTHLPNPLATEQRGGLGMVLSDAQSPTRAAGARLPHPQHFPKAAACSCSSAKCLSDLLSRLGAEVGPQSQAPRGVPEHHQNLLCGFGQIFALDAGDVVR